jgi:putative ABC transport system permease protein
MLAEGLVLALAGALVGTAVAHGGAKALAHLIPNAASLPGLASVGVNGRVLAFALGIAILTAVLASVQSVLTLGSKSFSAAMVASRGTSRGIGARRATATLVVAEIALGMVLLLGAGLILRSFRELIGVDPGFDRANVLTMSVSIPAERYGNPEAARGFVQLAEQRLKAIPGIEQVGEAVVIPLTGNNWTVPFDRADQPVPEGERPPDVGWQNASGGYFSALRIPLLSGRLFDETDRPGGTPVVIVSEAIQHQFFNDSNAVGRMIRLGQNQLEIVGVVGNIHRASLRDNPRADLYFPGEQRTGTQFNLLVRTTGEPMQSLSTITAALRELESNVVVDNPRTLEEIAREDTRVTELLLWLLGIFAVVALGLAAVGLYGIMSYVVRLRTREIGTRVALGASRSDIVTLVMRQGTRMAIAGVAIGFAGGLLAVRLLRTVVYGVGLTDPMTLVAASLTMLVTATLACYLPARRAAMVDPARTLTEE